MENNNTPHDSTKRLIDVNNAIFGLYNQIFKKEYGKQLENNDPELIAILDNLKDAIAMSKELEQGNFHLQEYLPAMQNMNNQKLGIIPGHYDIEGLLKKPAVVMPYERIQHTDLLINPRTSVAYLITIENMILQQFLAIVKKRIAEEPDTILEKIFLKYKYTITYINNFLENYYVTTSFKTIPVWDLSFEVMAQVMGISKQHYLDFENKIAFDIAERELVKTIHMAPAEEQTSYGYALAQMHSCDLEAALMHTDEKATSDLWKIFVSSVENPHYKAIHKDNSLILDLVERAFSEAIFTRMKDNEIKGFSKKLKYLN